MNDSHEDLIEVLFSKACEGIYRNDVTPIKELLAHGRDIAEANVGATQTLQTYAACLSRVTESCAVAGMMDECQEAFMTLANLSEKSNSSSIFRHLIFSYIRTTELIGRYGNLSQALAFRKKFLKTNSLLGADDFLLSQSEMLFQLSRNSAITLPSWNDVDEMLDVTRNLHQHLTPELQAKHADLIAQIEISVLSNFMMLAAHSHEWARLQKFSDDINKLAQEHPSISSDANRSARALYLWGISAFSANAPDQVNKAFVRLEALAKDEEVRLSAAPRRAQKAISYFGQLCGTISIMHAQNGNWQLADGSLSAMQKTLFDVPDWYSAGDYQTNLMLAGIAQRQGNQQAASICLTYANKLAQIYPKSVHFGVVDRDKLIAGPSEVVYPKRVKPMSDEALATLQARIGCSLPPSFINFIRETSGNVDGISFGILHEGGDGVETFLSGEKLVDTYDTLTDDIAWPFVWPFMMKIAENLGGAGNATFMSVNPNSVDFGAIYIWDHDKAWEQNTGLVMVAKSFDNFLASLRSSDDGVGLEVF